MIETRDDMLNFGCEILQCSGKRYSPCADQDRSCTLVDSQKNNRISLSASSTAETGYPKQRENKIMAIREDTLQDNVFQSERSHLEGDIQKMSSALDVFGQKYGSTKNSAIRPNNKTSGLKEQCIPYKSPFLTEREREHNITDEIRGMQKIMDALNQKIERTQKSDLESKTEILSLLHEMSITWDANMKIEFALQEHLQFRQEKISYLQNSLDTITTKFFLSEAELDDAQQRHTHFQEKLKAARIASNKVREKSDASINYLISCIEDLRKSLRSQVDEHRYEQIHENISNVSEVDLFKSREDHLTNNMIQRKIYCMQVENDTLHEVLSHMKNKANSGTDESTSNNRCILDYYNCCTTDVDIV
mmetsp:Transcript_22327/g.51156  ORF Transcript_22327/g.51156 Transcript_22327/m.51156 type:complete len:362 (-) Transcript_22327:29-1114(-)